MHRQTHVRRQAQPAFVVTIDVSADGPNAPRYKSCGKEGGRPLSRCKTRLLGKEEHLLKAHYRWKSLGCCWKRAVARHYHRGWCGRQRMKALNHFKVCSGNFIPRASHRNPASTKTLAPAFNARVAFHRVSGIIEYFRTTRYWNGVSEILSAFTDALDTLMFETRTESCSGWLYTHI